MASRTSAIPSRATIVRTLHETYHGPSWLGPTVRQALRRVTARQAVWRVASGRNTIWELALHLAAARHIMLERLTGERAKFPRKRRVTWWPIAPRRADEAAWRADLALLADYQERLLAAVARAPRARLTRVRPGGRWPLGEELLGTALHDAYHAGQIVLLARLAQ